MCLKENKETSSDYSEGMHTMAEAKLGGEERMNYECYWKPTQEFRLSRDIDSCWGFKEKESMTEVGTREPPALGNIGNGVCAEHGQLG